MKAKGEQEDSIKDHIVATFEKKIKNRNSTITFERWQGEVMVFLIPGDSMPLWEIFAEMEKMEHLVEFYGVNQMNLEQVFLKLS